MIAIVDDQEAVRRALARLLTSAGCQVEQFSSGESFLASLSDRVPDCLVLDLHMPEIDGVEVLRAIARLAPRLPVIVITGHDTPEARRLVAETIDCSFLRKPVDEQVLMSAISHEMGPFAPRASGSFDPPKSPGNHLEG